ncbi:hypothetical protein GCM10009119_17310 [Algoriphagus jejuensis]|uniref:Uncharacterized protein n=1 Tax=Algoriphagus jejuensis TaxID=419934 RepID=A0ABN1MZ10_9BACT
MNDQFLKSWVVKNPDRPMIPLDQRDVGGEKKEGTQSGQQGWGDWIKVKINPFLQRIILFM